MAASACEADGPAETPEFLKICTVEISEHCLPVAYIEALLVDPQARIVAAEPVSGGSQGSYLITLKSNHKGNQTRFRIKWRPHSTRNGMNSPRKEIITYVSQRLFLEPEEYVYPPTRSRCFELEQYRRKVDPSADATFPERSPCVFGTASYWVEGAEPVEENSWLGLDERPVFIEDWWFEDPVYRESLADANLLATLTCNGDTHNGNWLFQQTGEGKRVYLVDSSIALTLARNPSLAPGESFDEIVVPLRADSAKRTISIDYTDIEGLRAIERTVVQDGQLVSEWVQGAASKVTGTWTAELPSEQSQTVQVPEVAPYTWTSCFNDTSCDEEMVLGMTPFEVGIMQDALWHLQARLKVGEIPLLPEQLP